VSGVLLARLSRVERIRILTPASLAASAASALALSVRPPWTVAARPLLSFSTSVTTTITVGITFRQIVAPDHLRSSVNVIGRMVHWATPASTSSRWSVGILLDRELERASAALEDVAAAVLLEPVGTAASVPGLFPWRRAFQGV
jgi:hypothetical protein